MNKLKELRQKRAEIVKEMEALTKVEDDWTDEQRAKFDELEASAGELDKDIERFEKIASRKEHLTKLAPENDPEPRIEVGEGPADKPAFRSLGENLRAIVNASVPGARIDERLRPAPFIDDVSVLGGEKRGASGLSEGAGAYGGFFLQAEMADQLLDPAFSTGNLVPRVKQHIITQQNATSVKYQVLDETDRGVGYRLGGMRLYTRAEAEDVTSSKPKWREWEVKLNSIMGLCYFTNEQMEDTPWIVGQVEDYFNNEAGYELDEFILNGDGASEPLGITNHAALIAQAVETGQDSNTPYVSENFMNMYARMPARSRANAIWTHPADALPYFMHLEFPGISAIPLWIPGNSLAAAPNDRILSKPLVELEQAPTANTANDLMFIDPKQYLLVRKGGVKSDLSVHVRFLYGEVVLRFMFRVGGGSWWSSAITPANDGDTIGPFIGLAVRS